MKRVWTEASSVYINDHSDNSKMHTAVLKWLSSWEANHTNVRIGFQHNAIIIHLNSATDANILKLKLEQYNDYSHEKN